MCPTHKIKNITSVVSVFKHDKPTLLHITDDFTHKPKYIHTCSNCCLSSTLDPFIHTRLPISSIHPQTQTSEPMCLQFALNVNSPEKQDMLVFLSQKEQNQ